MTTCLHRVDLQVQVLVFDETVNTLSEDALQVALARATPGVSCHHSGDGGIRSQQGTELGGGFELSRQN